MSITKISEHQTKNTVEALEHLLFLAKSGELTGALFVCKYSHWHHAVWATGDYLKDPMPAVGASARMTRMLNRLVDSTAVENDSRPIVCRRRPQ